MALSLAFALMIFLLIISSAQGEANLEPITTPVADKIEILESANITTTEIQDVYNERDETKCLKTYNSKIPSTTCADGPYYNYYYEEGYLFRPPIRYKTCNGLTCQDLKSCVPTRSIVKFKWTNACKCDGCKYVERRCIRFIEELECQCQCPSSIDDCLFGRVWNPTQCRCVSNECPPQQYFDSTIYECVKDDPDDTKPDHLIY